MKAKGTKNLTFTQRLQLEAALSAGLHKKLLRTGSAFALLLSTTNCAGESMNTGKKSMIDIMVA